MAKFIKGKNRLKDLIYIQENKPCSDKAIDGMIRSMLEPLFDSPEEKGVVLYRFADESKYFGLLRRLKYTAVDIYNFSENSDDLKENIWENTEKITMITLV